MTPQDLHTAFASDFGMNVPADARSFVEVHSTHYGAQVAAHAAAARIAKVSKGRGDFGIA